MFTRIIDTLDLRAIFIIRFMVGGVFLSEGIQKFLHPAEVGAGRFAKIGLPWPDFFGPFVGGVEIFCGALVLSGLLTRLAVIPLLTIMAVAIWTTKIPILLDNGFWKMAHASRNDYCMVLGSVFLLVVGAGSWSIDWWLSRPTRRGPPFFARGLLFALAPLCWMGGPGLRAADAVEIPAPPAELNHATLALTVTFQGAVPKNRIADDAGRRRDLLQVDAATGGLRHVVAWLESGERNLQSSRLDEPRASAVMDQQDHEFVPRVLAVRPGQTVTFTNSDLANHNVRTSGSQPTNEFNVYTGISGSYRRQFVAERQSRPVRVACDIHPWMGAWIYVIEHSHFGVSDEQGQLRMSAIPPGRYRLQLRQPDIRYAAEKEITLSTGEILKLEFRAQEPGAAVQNQE